ncbi:MAG TPA: TonB-dependent receptor [Telluria sp.]
MSHRVAAQSQFRLKPLAAMVALALLVNTPAYAADAPEVEALRAEVARLKAALARSEQDLASVRLKEAPAAAPEFVAAPAVVEEPDKLGEITIRARKAIDLTHDVPQSVSVVSGKELDRELAQDLSAFAKRGSNISFNQNNTRGASLSIRGVGKRSFTETQDPSVGIILDDVSFGLTQLGNFDFYDVESVEVARGPQGTLGGKGASSGVVTVNTRKPSFTPSADFSLTFGQRETVIAKAALGGSVIDGLLAWRGAFVAHRSSGYYENAYDPENFTLYNKNRLSGRVQFLLTPTPSLSALFSADLEPKGAQLQNGLTFYHDAPERFENGSLSDPSGVSARAKLAGFTNAAGVKVAPRAWFQGRNGYSYENGYAGGEQRESVQFNENQGQTVSNKGASARVDWHTDGLDVASITAWRATSFRAENDEGTPFDISKLGGGGVRYRQLSQEFRFNATPSKLVDYQAGLYFLKTWDEIASKAGWGSDAGAWFATDAQYNTLDRGAGINRGAGLALLRESLADTFRQGNSAVRTRSEALFGQANWHLTDAFTLTTGLRVTDEDRNTTDTVTLSGNGVGRALNPVTVRGVPLGGFASAANGSLTADNSQTQLSLADTVANRYFGAVAGASPGDAYRALTPAQQAQVAAAKALRSGQIGQLISGVRSEYDDLLYTSVLSPSYKFTPNVTGYTSWQHGEKSGSAINVNGVSTTVRPEKTNAFEVGIKTISPTKDLTLNANLFLTNIRDYQQTVSVIDQFTTDRNIANGQANPLVYVAAQGNVNRVQAKGLEFDGVYQGIENVSLRLSGAYNDARYKDYKNAPKPDELAYLPQNFIDQSGKPLAGAAKWSFNAGAEYRRPLLGDRIFHTSFNTAFTSRYNNTDTLSSYGWVGAYSLTDASIGISTKSGFDLNLVIKNVFDKRAHEQGWVSYAPDPYPRWIGLVFSGKL